MSDQGDGLSGALIGHATGNKSVQCGTVDFCLVGFVSFAGFGLALFLGFGFVLAPDFILPGLFNGLRLALDGRRRISRFKPAARTAELI